ncbi:hypothetical protein PFISCL1PPCAC_10363, partial [Pristionchus fissidentatus]
TMNEVYLRLIYRLIYDGIQWNREESIDLPNLVVLSGIASIDAFLSETASLLLFEVDEAASLSTAFLLRLFDLALIKQTRFVFAAELAVEIDVLVEFLTGEDDGNEKEKDEEE